MPWSGPWSESSPHPPPRPRDGGSGSLLVLAVLSVAVLLAGTLGLLASAQAARVRAQTAADLGALAAAERALRGRADPCGAAREVVGRNGAVLVTCVVERGAVVAVRTSVGTPVGDATAQARAGPRAARAARRPAPDVTPRAGQRSTRYRRCASPA